MSRRQDIIDQLQTSFEGISTDNGYSFDIGSNVYEWRSTPLPKESVKAIIFRDVTETNEEQENLLEHTLIIDVDVYCNEGSDKAETLRTRKQDVLTAFQDILDVQEDGGAEFVQGAFYDGSEMFIEHGEKKQTLASMSFRIIYLTDLWEI